MKIILVIIFMVLCTQHTLAGSAVITGRAGSLKDGDSVFIVTNRYGEPDFAGYLDTYGAPVKAGVFTIKITTGTLPLRIVLLRFGASDPGKLLPGFYMEGGDNITVSRDSGRLGYSGKGSERWRIQQQLATIYSDHTVNTRWASVGGTRQYFADMDAALAEGMGYLNANKALLSKPVYRLLVSELAGLYLGKPGFIQDMRQEQRGEALLSVRDSVIRLPANVKAVLSDNDPIMAYAGGYATGLRIKYWFDSCALVGKTFDPAAYYRFVTTHYSGRLKERLVVNLLYKEREAPLNIAPLLLQAVGWVSDSTFRDILASMQAGRIKGAPAFNFCLAGADGKQYRQQDFLGKVVLLDFYYTGCGSCRAAHIYIDSIERLVADTSFKVVCISEDTDKDWFLKGTKTGKYASPASICLYSDGKGIDHPVFRYYSVSAFPTLILVDKYGKLMENPLDPVDDKGESLLALVRQALGR